MKGYIVLSLIGKEICKNIDKSISKNVEANTVNNFFVITLKNLLQIHLKVLQKSIDKTKATVDLIGTKIADEVA